MQDCSLCTIYNETYRVVKRNELVYAIIPDRPITPGHVLVAPVRHTHMEYMGPEELFYMNIMICNLKDILNELYPDAPPIVVTHLNTWHASVPEHVHYHIVPSPLNLRELIGTRDTESDLGALAEMLRVSFE